MGQIFFKRFYEDVVSEECGDFVNISTQSQIFEQNVDIFHQNISLHALIIDDWVVINLAKLPDILKQENSSRAITQSEESAEINESEDIKANVVLLECHRTVAVDRTKRIQNVQNISCYQQFVTHNNNTTKYSNVAKLAIHKQGTFRASKNKRKVKYCCKKISCHSSKFNRKPSVKGENIVCSILKNIPCLIVVLNLFVNIIISPVK